MENEDATLTQRAQEDAAYHVRTTARCTFGFVPDTTKDLWQNKILVLGSTRTSEYFSRLKTIAFHNLCEEGLELPSGIRNLLGLGLKFCIESPKPSSQIPLLHRSLDRFTRSLRIQYYINHVQRPPLHDPESLDYIPGLYIGSTWAPKQADYPLENAISNFRNELEKLTEQFPTTRRFNLRRIQRTCLGELRKRDDLIVFPTDKNLGPSICSRTPYIRQVLSEHLLKAENYENIPNDTIAIQLDTQRSNFVSLYNRYRHTLQTKAELTYFERALTEEYLAGTRVPQFYGTFKVHKGKKPKMRPIVSCVNSIPGIFSKWVDYWLKQVVRTHLPTYLRDVEHLLEDFSKMFPNGLPPNAKLFSLDAVGMYANIDTTHGIAMVSEYLESFPESLPRNIPKDFLIAALAEIMHNNIIQFGDTFWRQKSGCAMGTSAAVNYSYLYIGLLELKVLLHNHGAELLYFKRFIDDIIGIWVIKENHPEPWNAFFRDINNYGKLKWTTDGFQNEIVFMDLHIKVMPNGRIHTTTFQKELNLYLYIPPGSAHPRSMLRGLVFGRLRAYKLHNSDLSDFLHFARLLAERLANRGWDKLTLKKVFREAWQHIQTTNAPRIQATNETNKQRLFFHLPYHPRGIQRGTIQSLFKKHFQKVIPECKLTVAVSRPRNIGDRVCHTVLQDKQGDNPSDHL